jgi:hypothetical protein
MSFRDNEECIKCGLSAISASDDALIQHTTSKTRRQKKVERSGFEPLIHFMRQQNQ